MYSSTLVYRIVWVMVVHCLRDRMASQVNVTYFYRLNNCVHLCLALWYSLCVASLLLCLGLSVSGLTRHKMLVSNPPFVFLFRRYQNVVEVFLFLPDASPCGVLRPYNASRLRLSKQRDQSDEARQHTATHRAEFVTGHMALARLCLSRALAGRAPALVRPAAACSHGGLDLRHLFSSEATGRTSCREVPVADRSGSNTATHFPWRDLRVRDLVPFRLVDGLGSALSHVAETLSRPLLGKVWEAEDVYRLRFEVPGLGKDDVRVTVEDGALVIRGEKAVVEEDDDDGEWWSASSYGCYHASLLLPEDARADGITAEVKDGVLYVSVPRAPRRERTVTEVEVR
uniref:Uncharacterized protein n=1 Tax=Avena sativa TaxID=4498 RepID=A0ACD5ZN06_AVESA